MTRTELRTYTPEFRAEAVKLVLEQGLSLEAAAQRLSVSRDVGKLGQGRPAWTDGIDFSTWQP